MDSNGLGKLLPKSITSKRRRKKHQSDDSGEELGSRGRSPAPSRETFESDSTTSNSIPNSTRLTPEVASPAPAEEASFVSYESERDSLHSRPTAISTHPSQIGYLTASSPIVQEEHLQTSRGVDDPQPGRSPRTSTYPATKAASLGSDSSSQRAKTGPDLPRGKDSTRSSSPVGRFQEAFGPRADSTGAGTPVPVERPSTPGASDPRVDGPSRADSSTGDTGATRATSTERFQRLSRGQKINTTNPPQTPPNADNRPPVIVNTPPTPTDYSHPSSRTANLAPGPTGNASGRSRAPEPKPSNMMSERRVRSGSGTLVPSKLSNITLAPPTSASDNGPITPSASSFFSSMISAAQNAASTLSNTISNTNLGPVTNNRARGSSLQVEGGQDSDRVEVEPFPGATPQTMDSKEPAVRTLGMGDLSLSQLGIADATSNSTTPVASRFPESMDSRSRSESAPVESQSTAVGSDLASEDPYSTHLRSTHDLTGSGERSTPTGSLYEDKTGLQRTGSMRSTLGRQRNRGSSTATGATATTGGTIAAAISAANASVALPSAQASTTKLTGFAVASKKRNRDFHALFKSVPDDDYLIEDYSCALQREILAHGRLYVSEGHLCFSSNIFGWVTTLVMSFDEIVSVEKRSTALVFKNGLMISTLHSKHIFASFTSRDSTYDLIVKIWKLGHPSLQSSLNGVRLEETGGDKTEKIDRADEDIDSNASQSGSGSEEEFDEEDDVYDEDDEDQGDAQDTSQLTELGLPEAENEKSVSRKPSGAVTASGPSMEKPKDGSAGGGDGAGGSGASAGAGGGGDDFPGPATHAPTDCGEADTHFDKFLGDDVIPAPLGKVYSMIFGPASVSWMSKWLTNDQKCFDLQMDDKKGLGQDNRSRTFTYTKPLNASIGPKQTKCIVTEHLDNIDLEKAVNVTCTTQTPDVPSGNIFCVKTKYCLSWAENNSTRVQVNCTTEWTGKSWLKGPIEKGVNDGQTQYCKDIFTSLKAAVSTRARPGPPMNVGLVKGKKKGRKGKAAPASNPASDVEGSPIKSAAKEDWGMFEPIHGVVGPVVDIVKPLMTGNVVYGLLVGLLVASWFGFGFVNRAPPRHHYGHELGYLGGLGGGYPGYPDRLAAYDEMWRREESELWEWLEERVGLERLNGGAGTSEPANWNKNARNKKVVEPRNVEEKLREGRFEDREIREAIKVTEEKLKALKSSIEKRNSKNDQTSQ